MDSFSYLQKNVQCVFHAPCSMVILRMFFNNSRLVNHSYSLVVAGGFYFFDFLLQNFGEINGIQLDLLAHMFLEWLERKPPTSQVDSDICTP